MSSATVYVSLVLLFYLTSVEAKCGKPCYCLLGEKIEIPCGINGTYSWPQWKKGSVIITNEGFSFINPAYAARYSFDTDNGTLIIINVEKSDAGRYECFLPEYSPEAVEVIVKEPFDACGIKITILVFVLPAIVVIIIQWGILIKMYKKYKQNENKNEDKLIVLTVLSILILVIAAVLIAVGLKLITGRPVSIIEEDCEKLTKMEHSFYVKFFVVEIIVFVLGYINGLVYIYLVMKRKKFRGYCKRYTKDTSDNHVTGGDTVSIEDNEVPNAEELLKEELEKEGSVNDNAREVIEPVMKRKKFRGYCEPYTKDTSDNTVTGGDTVRFPALEYSPQAAILRKKVAGYIPQNTH